MTFPSPDIGNPTIHPEGSMAKVISFSPTEKDRIETSIYEQSGNNGSLEYLLQIQTESYFKQLMSAMNLADYQYIKIPDAPMVTTRSTRSSGSTRTETENISSPFLVQELYITTPSGVDYKFAILRRPSASEEVFRRGIEVYLIEVNKILEVYEKPPLDLNFLAINKLLDG